MYESTVKLSDNLTITFHRTVRVPEGRTPANLPPSLGHFPVERVSEHKPRCPVGWSIHGVFLPLYDVEALWLSFNVSDQPVALLVGAGGINAITGEKLGTELTEGNYLVAPPQPWLDGWKGPDGNVFQFVGTHYEGGKGKTVGEQILGAQSKTGAIGLALFAPKKNLPMNASPGHSGGYGATGQSIGMAGASGDYYGEEQAAVSSSYVYGAAIPKAVYASASPRGIGGQQVNSSRGAIRAAAASAEMGLGKGGQIIQKIYPDPYGLDVWKPKPVATMAVYFVNAEMYSDITGKPCPPLPRASHEYYTQYFKVHDGHTGDVKGSEKFAGLTSAMDAKKEPVGGAAAFPGMK